MLATLQCQNLGRRAEVDLIHTEMGFWLESINSHYWLTQRLWRWFQSWEDAILNVLQDLCGISQSCSTPLRMEESLPDRGRVLKKSSPENLSWLVRLIVPNPVAFRSQCHLWGSAVHSRVTVTQQPLQTCLHSWGINSSHRLEETGFWQMFTGLLLHYLSAFP